MHNTKEHFLISYPDAKAATFIRILFYIVFPIIFLKLYNKFILHIVSNTQTCYLI